MVRKFNIEISTYGWEIDILGFNGTYKVYKAIDEAPVSIGVCVKEDEKLLAMYDPFVPKDEAIIEANELEIFKEECEFTHLNNIFKGTFVDALIYIQKQYIDNKVPTLEELQSE